MPPKLRKRIVTRFGSWRSNGTPDIFALATAYAFGIVRNHPYRDGNERVGFLSMVTLLELNGRAFAATDVEVAAEIVALADRIVTEEALAGWIRQHSRRQT